MQFSTTLFYTLALAFAALGAQAADNSTAAASGTQADSAVASSTAPANISSSLASSGSASPTASGNATNATTTDTGKNHAMQGVSLDRSLMFGAAAVLGGTILGAVAVL